jgi:hypothetical protein
VGVHLDVSPNTPNINPFTHSVLSNSISDETAWLVVQFYYIYEHTPLVSEQRCIFAMPDHCIINITTNAAQLKYDLTLPDKIWQLARVSFPFFKLSQSLYVHEYGNW